MCVRIGKDQEQEQLNFDRIANCFNRQEFDCLFHPLIFAWAFASGAAAVSAEQEQLWHCLATVANWKRATRDLVCGKFNQRTGGEQTRLGMRIGDADKIGRRTDKHSITCLHENQLQVSDGASVFKFGGVSCSFSAASLLE